MEDTISQPTQPSEPPKKIRTCPHCHQPMEIKDPWKALWRLPSLQEWLILFMMAMMIFAAWAYRHDVGVCQDFIKNADTFCMSRGAVNIGHNYTSWSTANLSGVIISNVSNTTVNVSNVTIIVMNETETNKTNDLNNASSNETR